MESDRLRSKICRKSWTYSGSLVRWTLLVWDAMAWPLLPFWSLHDRRGHTERIPVIGLAMELTNWFGGQAKENQVQDLLPCIPEMWSWSELDISGELWQIRDGDLYLQLIADDEEDVDVEDLAMCHWWKARLKEEALASSDLFWGWDFLPISYALVLARCHECVVVILSTGGMQQVILYYCSTVLTAFHVYQNWSVGSYFITWSIFWS